MFELKHIARKEFAGFFASPAAFLFIGTFLAITLFVFFWVDTFFARNLADVRPLFQWMPILLVFLVSALTMRSWSEERRSGTLETLLTSPVAPFQLVLGKFLGGVALVGVAVVLTLPLPFTVAFLGPMDWGPVFGGYLATLFLAAAYVSIGLYMSSRTDNPIVALILTTVVCGIFYLLGSPVLTSLFGHKMGGLFAMIGTGSRFESITRGVLDLRDLYYYLSIVGVFLTLNLYSLEKSRWAGNPQSVRHRHWGLVTLLVAANFVAGNLWLQSVNWIRADITEGNNYSLSAATEQTLARLQEPMLIRGYFSANTHPLLAPLVPQIRDMLKEYAVIGKGRLQVEFVDPQQDAAMEEEAASKYGIQPVPFQMASRYQTSVVNSYFDLLIAYGDQHETLSYRHLIEIKARGEGELDVVLNNPEYAITQAIRKTMNAYQAGGNPFETLTKPVVFNGYFSDKEKLPKGMDEVRGTVEEVVRELEEGSGGKFTSQWQDPDAQDGQLGKELKEKFGFRPQIASLLDPRPFWFYMVLASGGESVQIPLGKEFSKDTLRRSIESAIKRFAPGFLKTVALLKPESGMEEQGKRYSRLQEALSEDVRLKETDLKDGRVPEEADMLLALSPKDLSEKQVFAVDQFLMQGGTVLLATSPFDVNVGQYLEAAKKQSSGLKEWLGHKGIEIEEKMVLDPQNASLPVPVKRYIGPVAVREIRMLSYPHFPDLREAGLNKENPITANLRQLTVNWVSPVRVDTEKNKERKMTRLLTSSPDSWTSESVEVVPNYKMYPKQGFAPAEKRSAQLLAVVVEGRFDSFFKDRESPLVEKKEEKSDEPSTAPAGTAAEAKLQAIKAMTGKKDDKDKNGDGEKKGGPTLTSVIDRSPESARIIVLASNGFASDAVVELASEGVGTLYTKPLEFIQNTVDWTLTDQSLLGIRGRARFARTLVPMEQTQQMLVEYLNYGLALLGLVAVWGWRRQVRRITEARHQAILAEA